MKEIILEVNNLSVLYGTQKILDNISFSVERGDYIGLVGPNGAGKSTLVKTLLGVVKANLGEIHYSQGIRSSYLPQIANGIKKFPARVDEIIATSLFNLKLSKSEIEEKISSVLDILDIRGLRSHLIGELSGGQLQRVLLARAIVGGADIIYLDEPTSALDPSIREKFYEIIGMLNTEYNMTIILVSHDHGSMISNAKKILELDTVIKYYGESSKYSGGGEAHVH